MQSPKTGYADFIDPIKSTHIKVKINFCGDYGKGLEFLSANTLPCKQLPEPFKTMEGWRDPNFAPHTSDTTFSYRGDVNYINKGHKGDEIIIGFSEASNEIYVFGSVETYKILLSDLRVSNLAISPLHGAVLVDANNRAIVILGNSGVGKSTLTLEAASYGYGVLSDEFVVTDGNFAYSHLTGIKSDAKTLETNVMLWTMKPMLNNGTIDPKALLRHFKLPPFDMAKIYKSAVLHTKSWEGKKSLKRPFPAAVHDSYWALYATSRDWAIQLENIRSKSYAFLDRILDSARIIENFDIKNNAMHEDFLKWLLK